MALKHLRITESGLLIDTETDEFIKAIPIQKPIFFEYVPHAPDNHHSSYKGRVEMIAHEINEGNKYRDDRLETSIDAWVGGLNIPLRKHYGDGNGIYDSPVYLSLVQFYHIPRKFKLILIEREGRFCFTTEEVAVD